MQDPISEWRDSATGIEDLVRPSQLRPQSEALLAKKPWNETQMSVVEDIRSSEKPEYAPASNACFRIIVICVHDSFSHRR
eukprot:3751453-Rhodomonas_salina.1